MSNEDVTALAALYQAEKSDTSGMFSTSMALMGIGAAYIVGALGYLSKQEIHSIPAPLVALAPAPLWLIAAFQSLITLASMMHTILLEVVEEALLGKSGLAQEKLVHTGSKGAAEIMDIRRANWVHGATTVFVYGGVFASVIGFTCYALNRAWPYLGDGGHIIAVCGYSLALATVLLCWQKGLERVGQAAEEAAPLLKSTPPANGAPAGSAQNQGGNWLRLLNRKPPNGAPRH